MPKAILEFNLPEELGEYRLAIDGAAWSIVVWELQEWLRDKYKYQGEETIKIDEVRAKIVELMDEHSLEHS